MTRLCGWRTAPWKQRIRFSPQRDQPVRSRTQHFARLAAMRTTSMGSRGPVHATDVTAMHTAAERSMRLTTAISSTPRLVLAKNHLTRNGSSPRSLSIKLSTPINLHRTAVLANSRVHIISPPHDWQASLMSPHSWSCRASVVWEAFNKRNIAKVESF